MRATGPTLTTCRKQGYRARSAGKLALTCPYPKGLDGRQQVWLEGWMASEIEVELDLERKGLSAGPADVMLKVCFARHGLQADLYKNGYPAHSRCRDFGGSNPVRMHVERMTEMLLKLVGGFESVPKSRRKKCSPKP